MLLMAALFSEYERTDASGVQANETSFQWLDRCARPECEIGRRELNTFFDSLSAEIQHRVRRRLGKNRDHDSVVAEAYGYLLFKELGFEVTYEPALGTRSNPDLLIARGSEEIAVDVTIDCGIGSFNRARLRMDRLVDSLNDRVKVTGCAFALRSYVEGHSNPSQTKLARELQRIADGLDLARLAQMDHIPEYQIEDRASGWRLTLSPIANGEPTRITKSAVGMRSIGTLWSDGVGIIRGKVDEKVAQHRDLAYPLVVLIAMNDFASRPDHEDIQGALYGGTVASPASSGREQDWVWRPGRERPLAVITCPNVFAWSLHRRDVTLWANPMLESITLHRSWKYPVERMPL